MKNYLLENYGNNLRTLREEMIKDLNEDFADLEITSNKYTDCEILEVLRFTELGGKHDVLVEVSCNAGILSFCLKHCSENGLLTLPLEKQKLLNDYFMQYEKAVDDYKVIVDEVSKQASIEAAEKAKIFEAKKKVYEEKKAAEKAEKKFQKKVANSIKKFNNDISTKVVVEADLVDWIKDNVSSITATIPSHLEKVFIRVFGDQPHNVVDSNKKTSGGYSMKFGPSFCLTIKKDATTIPAELVDKIKNNKIQNTSFIANLVRVYGLSFGKQA